MEKDNLTRVARRRLQLLELVAGVVLSPQVTRLLVIRMRDNPIDFDGRVAILRFLQWTYLALFAMAGALAVTFSWMAAGYGGQQTLIAGLGLLAVGFLFAANHARTERQLRSHIAHLRLAAELFTLVRQHSAVRAYVECAVEVYPWLSGLDVELARAIAMHEESAKGTCEAREAEALERLCQLPYVDFIEQVGPKTLSGLV